MLFTLFSQKGRVKEREEEKYQYVVASHAPPTGDLVLVPRSSGMCPKPRIEQVTL